MNLTVVFANILGGYEYLGTKYGDLKLGDDAIDKYISVLSTYNPDILSLAEVHLEDDTHSDMIQVIAERMNYNYFDILGTDKSHLNEGKILGNAILSKVPILESEHFTIESPRIEVDRPNGDHWVMHNKGAQRIRVKVGSKIVSVTNLHYFPFHHFNRQMNEVEFAPQREKLVSMLTNENECDVSLVTGDFNNNGFTLRNAFPELFEAGYEETLEVETTIKGAYHQQDHILYKPDQVNLVSAEVFTIPSDHFALRATISF